MRQISSATREAIYSPVKDDETRYYWRVTIEAGLLRWTDYDTENAPGGDYGHDRPRTGHFSSMVFGSIAKHGAVREIPSIKSGTITRDLGQDVAEITLTLLNTTISPIGESEDEYTGSMEYDVPGALSYSRGTPTIDANRWGHVETGWEKIIAPDRIMRSYEGYGIDRSVPAGFDEHMYASGIWLIDTVSLNSDGDVVIKGRDLGRLLIDHIAIPPNIPWDSYPLEWSKIDALEVEARAPTGGTWSVPASDTRSSNDKYVGRGIVDDPTYVSGAGGVLGHHAADPITSGYWLSTGQESQDSFVWWEVDLDSPTDVSAVRLRTLGGPFVVYISLHDGTDWVGQKKIPYRVTTEDVDLDARIKFVHTERFEREVREDIVLHRRYENISKIRITFTRLKRRPGAKNYPWRAGLREFHVYHGSHDSMGFDTSGTVLKAIGNYRDYTDIIKWICAWSGFWWPENDAARTIAYGLLDTYDVVYDYLGQDAILARGRVWGSFELTGTAGVADLTADQFDKQPLMDAIQVVRNIVGFTFFVDECGGIVWRMPNLYQRGNYVTPSHLNNEGRHPTYLAGSHETLDETDILRQYSTELDSKNLRERIAVAGTDGKIGAVIKGYHPYHTGLKRIAVWTDQHWDTNRECRVAADMIAAQQMFSFRKSTSVIPPHPGIQIDDQIRIFEKVTNETFFHYVTGISSTYDADTNKGEYTVTSHWLGERLSDAWVVRVDQLDHLTQAFLNHIGPVD